MSDANNTTSSTDIPVNTPQPALTVQPAGGDHSLTLEQIADFQKRLIDSKVGLEKLNLEEKAEYVNEFARCEKIKHEALSSRKVRYLFNSLAEMGSVVMAPEKFVQCVHCDQPLNAFALVTPDNKSMIGMCQNYVRDQTTTVNSLTHELVHIYDQMRAHVDLNNCVHVACTEVRAAALSGECTKAREEERGILAPFSANPGHFRRCVWRKAANSVAFQPLCQDKDVCDKAMNLAFDRCISDLSPFFAIPE